MKDLEVVDLGKVGPMLEHHMLFPEGANISLARVVSKDHVFLKVWERARRADAAPAARRPARAMAAGFRINMINRKCKITLPGGDLFMEQREGTITS